MSGSARESTPLLVISLGDPAGIGPELVLKAARRWAQEGPAPARLAVTAPASVLQAWSRRLGIPVDLREGDLDTVIPGGLTALGWGVSAPARAVEEQVLASLEAELDGMDVADLPPRPSRAGGAAAWLSLARAVDLALQNPRRRALVTAPVCKEALALAGFSWPGHTEYLGWRCGVDDPLMWLDSPALSVGLVSNHDPLCDLPSRLTPERVERKARLACRHLAARRPGERLGLLAVNPHAGDGGHLGSEERDWLGPLAESLRREGLPLDGPLPADAALARGRGRFLAMYHDQGLPVFKLVAGPQGVNTTLGLPITRCSPDHGTAFDISGRGLADEGSLMAALAEALLQLRTAAGL